MTGNAKYRGALGAIALVLMASVAVADVPAAFNLTYQIHDDPNDPNSPIAYTIALDLASSSYTATEIGWDITHVQFIEHDPNGDMVWEEDDPNVPTVDGLWWVEHADINDPQPNEFVGLPALTGLASTQDPNQTGLDYDLEGAGSASPSGQVLLSY